MTVLPSSTISAPDELRLQQRAGIRRIMLVVLILAAVVVGNQILSGAYQAEFGGEPDEPAHYISAITVRDYIATAFGQSPMQFAATYYDHYPRVSIGHWPPVFYLLDGGWMLIFGTSRVSAIIFTGLIAFLLAFAVYRAASLWMPQTGAVIAAILLLLSPMIQSAMGMVMLDTMVVLFCFLATWAFSEFASTERQRPVYLFSLFTVLALMTKGNAMALVLMPLITLAFTRRLRLLFKPDLWVGIAIIGIACGPWYLYWRHAAAFADRPGLAYIAKAIPFFTTQTILLFGWVLSALALIGFWDRVVRPFVKGQAVSPFWAAQAGLILGVLGFQSVVAVGLDARYTMACAPGMILFIFSALLYLAGLTHTRYVWWAGAAALVFLATGFHMSYQQPSGFAEAADLAVSRLPSMAKILASSDTTGEGMFISELAQREHRPGRFVRRGSKVLEMHGWDGSHKFLMQTPEEVQAYLDKEQIQMIVLDRTKGTNWRERDYLRETLDRYPNQWELAGTRFNPDQSMELKLFLRRPVTK